MTSTCENCPAPLQQSGRGPRRRFCSDRCRLASRRVLRIAPIASPPADQGAMGQAARAVAAEARRRRTLSAMDEAALTALTAVGDALDSQSGSAALVHEWRGLLSDLRLEVPGQPQRDLAALLEDFRSDIGQRRHVS
jgi:hypothetical protein